MQRMEMLLSKTPPTDVKSDVLPMIYRALESDASQIQELCLSIIPGFAGTTRLMILLQSKSNSYSLPSLILLLSDGHCRKRQVQSFS